MQRFALLVGWLVLISCGGGKSTPATSPAEPTPRPEEAKVSTPPPATGDDDRVSLTSFDDANPQSVSRAIKAADAIGERRDGAAIDALASVIARPPSKKILALQIAAIRALGKMDGAKPKAAQVLASVLARQAPPAPKTPDMETAFAIYLSTVGSAINASTELGERSLAGALVPVIYRTPELSSQLRRAFAAMADVAAPEFRKVLHGENATVEAMMKATFDPANPTSAHDFYAVMVLGDLRDAGAVADLLAVIAKPTAPAYYYEGDPAPVTQHTAAFDALRKLGVPEAAPKLEAMWRDNRVDLADRSDAIRAFTFSTRDAAAVGALAQIALDNTADDTLRTEAASAVGRLARDGKHINAFRILAKKYMDASAKKRAAANKLEPKKKKADVALDDAKDAAEKARTKVKTLIADQNSSAAEITAATDAAKKADLNLTQARKQHRSDTGEWKSNDAASKAYVGYARMFQTHVARIEIGTACKDNVDCYIKGLRATPEDVARDVKKYIKDVDSWSVDEKLGLAEAYADRAMVEIGKRGQLADDKLALVLEALANENRLVRESILNALPRIAPTKCPACLTALDAAIESGRTKTYLAGLQIETQIVRNYMASR